MGTFGLGGLHRKGTWLYPVATFAALPPVAVDGAVAVALDTNIPYEYDASLPGWIVLPSGGGSVTIPPSIFDFGEHGFECDYSGSGSPQAANEVQYVRVWITDTMTITAMRARIFNGANGVRQIRMGIYNQATPTSNTGTPNTRVAQTAADTPPSGFTGARDVTLTASYSPPTTGWHWLALQADNARMSFILSEGVYRVNQSPRREENPGVFGLPATAGATTQPQSAVIYSTALE